jgi:hypothetical protein
MGDSDHIPRQSERSSRLAQDGLMISHIPRAALSIENQEYPKSVSVFQKGRKRYGK